MWLIILMFHILIAICLIGLVLLQHGKGADVGAAFGSGASSTVFGSQGPTSFLMKLTGLLAALFFATSLILSYIATQESKQTRQVILPTAIPNSINNEQQIPTQTKSQLPQTEQQNK